jgi:uncharacterized membrane protein
MTHARTIVRIGLALIMAGAGLLHFVNPRPYVEHLPAFLPLRGELIALTGAMELVLAAGLVGPPRWRRPAALALAAYLVLVFPANIYAAVSQVPIDGVPTGWVRWARLPLQLPLIAAAWWIAATRPSRRGRLTPPSARR